MHESLAALGRATPAAAMPGMRQAGGVAVQASTLRRQLEPFGGDNVASPVAYPTENAGDFPQSMAALASMIGAGLPLRCVAVTGPGGYDTHDEQPKDLEEGLKGTSETLLAFQRDLEARGIADRVLVQVWSEFGRRGEENASKGTDHGAAGIGFLIGTRSRGTMVGEFPGLDRLDEDGNLRASFDFRSLYCALLEQWFDADAAAVIPEAARFKRAALLK